MRPPIDGGTVLITGASAGIGRELARQLAPRAAKLVLIARRLERLEALRRELIASHPRLEVILERCDLANDEDIEAMMDRVERNAGDIDVVINNAGLGDQALYDQSDWARIEQMLRVNIFALSRITHRFVRPMVTRRRGGILNLSSGAGFAWIPGAAMYVATKHFVTAFTENLRLDLVDTGVVVTQVCPGPVATEFNQVAGITDALGPVPPFLRLTAERCVRDALRAFDAGRAAVFPGLGFRLLMIAPRSVPRVVQRLVMRPAARQTRQKLILTEDTSEG